MWSQAFQMEGGGIPQPPPPTLLFQVAHVGGDWQQRLRALSKGCVLFHINDKEESGAGTRSHYHTLICLKRAGVTIQSAGVHRNPVKALGGRVRQ